MRLQINRRVTVNAPASKTWRVIAHEFGEIERWSSGIKVSRGTSEDTAPEGAPIAGRHCDAIQERFTHFDEQAMEFGYEMVDPPWFVRNIGNSWRVHSLEPDKSIIEMRPEIECHLILGLFIAPLLKLFGRIVVDRTFAEVAYYIENDQPHPRKQKQMERARQHTSVPQNH
ncbi:MAG: SRPBCC family protein [Chloroflexota bacterium]